MMDSSRSAERAKKHRLDQFADGRQTQGGGGGCGIAPTHRRFSQPPKSNFRVRAKEPSCPNEKALDEERRPFSQRGRIDCRKQEA